MTRGRIVLLATLALAAPVFLLGAGPYRSPNVKQVPGAPLIAKQPDLIVDSVEISWGNTSPCVGVHTMEYQITVKLRNGGFAPATLPNPWSHWLVVWSTIGTNAPPFKAWAYGAPAQLASGATYVFKTKLTVQALVATDKKSSSVSVGAIADPDNVIPEINETNNTRITTQTFGGELCPEGS